MFPQLSPRELHLWRIDLDRPLPAELNVLAECLSAEERRRAERFLRESDRRRFLVSHAAAREIFGQYLGIPPRGVELKARAGGKPELSLRPEMPPLRYNLSHSGELAMIAVALDREVGVDLERVRPCNDVGNIVERYFAPGERTAWRALADHERLDAFFRGWTRKEAYLKARGVGLFSALDRFEVSLAPGEPARLLRVDELQDSIARWQVYDVSPGNGYMAACVVEAGIDKVSVYDWPLLSATQPGPKHAPGTHNRRPS